MADNENESVLLNDYHNQNCFAYLKEISDTPRALLDMLFGKDEFTELKNLLTQEDYRYDPSISYANLYSRFLSILEENASTLNTYFEKDEDYKKWFNRIYANPNKILFETFELFKDKLAQRSLIDARPEEMVATALDAFAGSNTTHMFTPKDMGSYVGRLVALLSSNFKPMLTTSIPSTRNYNYTSQNPQYPQELRFGTQAQRHEDEVRVSPLFEEWLRVHQHEDKIKHVYFNLLGADRTDFEGKKETAMTEALTNLEQNHTNIAVITLPADKGLMEAKAYQDREQNISASSAFEEMKEIVLGTSKLPIKDFYVSDQIKLKLYAAGKEEEKVQELLVKSFKKMGIEPNQDTQLSTAQRQAVWFDFCKYEFPNFVLKKLQPSTWNASCKDAIDRGGVASSYLNLMRSFESPSPMSRDEFEQSLHAAAAVVKGRGLNHHYEMIWNAVDHYVDANFERLAEEPNKHWLIHWRNDNTPYSAAQSQDYLYKVINQNRELINKVPVQPDDNITKQLKENSIKVLMAVKEELFNRDDAAKPVSGKRLLLEVASKTTQLAYEPHDQNTRNQLNGALDELNKSSIFQPICKILVSFIDFLAKYFTAVKSMQGAFYSTLVRYANKREAINKIRGLSQDPQPPHPH